MKTIMNWQASKSVKSVQSFIDFANFYQKFIKNFSNLIMSMMTLIQKNTLFKWTEKVNQDFMKIKVMFISVSILVSFDHTCMTMMKTDFSEWYINETLLQLMNNVWRLCAYYSKKNASAECNYEIYDKEMLIIIWCLKEWDTELRSVSSFQICTDHKNLKYFITVRKLTEWQMRWSLILSQYNFFILYLLSKQNERTDTLLRQKQNVSMNLSDDRVQHCTTQIIHSEMISKPIQTVSMTVANISVSVLIQDQNLFSETTDLKQMWVNAEAEDELYNELYQTICKKQRSFSTVLKVRVFIMKCFLSDEEKLLFHRRHWVLLSESLCTELIQYTHDLTMTEHSKRDVTGALLSWQFFWLKMLQNVCTFCQNCNKCCMNNSWKDRWQGFLKPLPVSEWIWWEIFINFIVDLLSSESCTNLLIIMNCLSKRVILESCKNMTAEWVTQTFVQHFYWAYELFIAIVSDWDTQFVSSLWKRVCQLLKIIQRVFTAYHLKTDRATEQMNQNVELYICMFSNHSQNNWASLLLMTELVINNHDFILTEVSFFFLFHEYHMKSLQLLEKLKPVWSVKSSVQKADQIVQKMKEVTEWAQITMTLTQQIQKEMMNWKRQQSYNFKKEDKIWLNLKNIHTDHLCKKFDVKNDKYIIVKKINSHSFCLNTLLSIHNVFHSVMLQSAVMNTLFSQCTTDSQPSSQIVSDEEKFEIKKILKKRFVWHKEEFKKKYLIKWVSYTWLTWESAFTLKDTVMLNQWELMQSELTKS